MQPETTWHLLLLDFWIEYTATFYLLLMNLVSSVVFLTSLGLFAYTLPGKIPTRLPVLWEEHIAYVVFFILIGTAAMFSGFFTLLGKRLNTVLSLVIPFVLHIVIIGFLAFGTYSMIFIMFPQEKNYYWTLSTLFQGITAVFQLCFVIETIVWYFACRKKSNRWQGLAQPHYELRSTFVNDPLKDSGF